MFTPQQIKDLRRERKLTQQALADILGISRELVSKMENGDSISRATNILLENYRDTGSIANKIPDSGAPNNPLNLPTTQRRSKGRVPFYDAPADAGNVDRDMLPITEPTGYVDTGDLFGTKCEAVIRIRGNSMLAGFPSGSLIGLNRHYDSFIQPGELFVMETRSQRVFKRVYSDDARSEDWECYSDNEELYSNGPRAGKPKYPSFFIPKEEILKIWMVVGCAREEGNSIVIHPNPTT